jgi:hypothetical protein
MTFGQVSTKGSGETADAEALRFSYRPPRNALSSDVTTYRHARAVVLGTTAAERERRTGPWSTTACGALFAYLS